MRKTFLISVLLFIVFSLSIAQQPTMDELFDKGNKEYNEGQYEESIVSYEEIRNSGFENGELYYNLANSYFKAGNIGKAVLYFEKAKKLLPGDEDVNANLEFLNSLLIDRIEVVPEPAVIKAGKKFLSFFGTNLSAILMTAALLGFTIFFGLRTFLPGYYRLLGPLMIIFLIFTLIFSSIYFINVKIAQNNIFGVIISPSANVKNSPGDSSPVSFIIHEGLKVGILRSFDNWLEIRLADGKIGWIETSALEKI